MHRSANSQKYAMNLVGAIDRGTGKSGSCAQRGTKLVQDEWNEGQESRDQSQEQASVLAAQVVEELGGEEG